MKVAKAKGRLRGKQPKLKPAQEAHLVELWHAGGDGRGLGILATRVTSAVSGLRRTVRWPTAMDMGSVLAGISR
jgi:hypothetical protein